MLQRIFKRAGTALKQHATLFLAVTLVIFVLAWAPQAFAFRGDEDAASTPKDYLFRLVRSSFGTLVMMFCGIGGFVVLYMQRVGRKGQQVPLAGIAMLLIALGLFLMRTMVTSGLLGKDYLDYGR